MVDKTTNTNMPTTTIQEDFFKSIHFNNAVDGFTYYQGNASRKHGPLFTFANYQSLFNGYHDVRGVGIYTGNKAPVFGSEGARWVSSENNAPYNLNYNLIFEGDNDDEYTGGENLPFSFYMGGSGYTNIYTGSNTYWTFGDGSDEYDDLSANNPNIPKILVGAEDHSYQRVWSKVTAECYRVRYEGTDSTSGSEGDPNIVIEITFCNPQRYNGRMVCEILVGRHDAVSDGVTLIASADTQLCLNAPSLQENTSYVLVGDSKGDVWTVIPNVYLSNPPY